MSETEAIRSDIEMTRRRMDDTMNALSERMHGRHLLDEVIGFFRHNTERTSEAGARVREKLSDAAGKVSESAGNAANAIVDTVKKNPIPFVLIGAGAAWLAYSATRRRTPDVEDDITDESDRYDPDTHYDRPLAYPGSDPAGETGVSEAADAGSKLSHMKDNVKDKAAAAKDQVKQKLSDLSDKTRDTFQSAKERASEFGSRVRERASEFGGQVQERTREVYDKTRDRVAETADAHPLEVGLGCLAVGVLIGLALPTPQPVHRVAGPTVDRLRNRTREAGREMLQKGRRVVQAATDAAKHEAESQGLTVDRLRQGAAAVGERAESAAAEASQEEGMPGNAGEQRTGSEPADPSAARPAM